MWGTDDPNAGNTGGGGGGGSQGGPWEFSSNTYVTDPGVMPGGADASWIKGSQSTWGPNANWSAGNGAYYLLGDSFTLDAATNINEIEVYGYQTGSTTTSTFTGLYAQIYNGNPMDGATVVWGDINTNLMTATAFTNCYRGTDGDTGGTTRPIMSVTASGLDIQLPAGTYYLVYAMTGSMSSGPWGVPHCEPGIGNTGNGVQCNTTGWTLLNDSGSGTPYGCAMKLSGNTRGENAGRHLEGYKVMCTNSFGEPIFNANTPADQPFCQVATDRLVEGQKYLFQVASIYSTGMSDYAMEVEFEYEKCDNYQDIPVQGNASAQGNTLTWNAKEGRAMWDLLGSFNAAEGAQYGIATDGVNFYTSNWGYSSATHNFYKYDLQGNVIEGFEIAGCGTLRGMAYDGQYFYGVANSNTVYCVDLANHTLVGQFTTTYGAMRCITYDPVRDGFWVVGNWSGDLTLIDRTGAILQVGPTPQSASDVAYYKDDNDVEHVLVYSQPGGNGNAVVFDYNITTNTLGGQVFNFSSVSGVSGDASSGGCHIANYGDKLAFYGDMQQSPNYIVICELGEAGGGGQPAGVLTPNKFNILVDGEVVGVTASSYYTYECPDYENHVYTVVWVDANYGVSCEASVEYQIGLGVNEYELVNAIYPNPTSGDLHINAQAMTRISIVNTMGQVVYEQNVNADAIVVDMAKFEAGVYMVNIYTENGSSVKRVTVVK